MAFLVLPKVTVNLPITNIDVSGWSIPNGIELADPAFFESKAVDIVLGIEAFFEFFVTGRRISLGERFPSFNESVFGWVVSGGLSEPRKSLHTTCNTSMVETLDALVQRFWSSEEVDPIKPYSPEDRKCEEVFRNTFKRAADGRYSVSLPKCDDVLAKLGDSQDIALRRLQGIERRLARDDNLRSQYVSFMEEYLRLGHMTKVEGNVEGPKRCFLPHHPVVKEASTTTKVRVVFDASCKTSSKVSLNDSLLAGPVIQDDLRSIIMRCRTKQIMLVSDVEKMFRQIEIHPEDRWLQNILWRSSTDEEVGIYELNTVTYGTKPAPFLATRTLTQLALDEEARYPLAAKAISEDTYMDDVITGTDDPATACDLRQQLDDLTSSGGFRLRKWASNSSDVLKGVPDDNLAVPGTKEINLDPDPTVKTLGLVWIPTSDFFKFNFTIPPVDTTAALTKRQILSVVASLFDPLGLLGAVITTAKIFLQQLWSIRSLNNEPLAWDDLIPSTVGEAWNLFHRALPRLNDVRIPRCVVVRDWIATELHCFSDASMKAYGAVVYLKSWTADGKVMVGLLASKSRVAPLKVQTIPRLELCGAEMAAKLVSKVRASIKSRVEAFFWTDSTCVLRWIQAPPLTWSVYIANRVSTIQTLTEGSTWQHVPGTENPADLISRGIAPEEIISNEFWWEGPSWLKKGNDYWPRTPFNLPDTDVDLERRRTTAAVTASTVGEFNLWYMGKFSSFSDLVRRTAYWLRLMKLLRSPADKRTEGKSLTTAELFEAERCLVRRVQMESFSDEWKVLSKKESVSHRSPLRWFNPYLAEDGLIRVGGRLGNSLEADSSKHPVVLPARHTFTKLLVKHYHQRLLHAGPQLMLSAIRLRYWPLGGRSVAKQIVHQCQRCFRAKPTPIQQFMGELPASRVTVARPFSRTGVDYFGPVYVIPAQRKAAVKAYVAVFICLCTKAVHIELVSDLSTGRFIQALRRFISRRGLCSDIYSDNGTNFVGARNKLVEFLKLLKNIKHHEEIEKECALEGIQWHFSPPSGPHFGGIWEAAVRSAKQHILKTVGDNPMNLEDFSTLLVQVEACMNSRPLTPISNDPNDLEPLTPGHFLVGSSLQALPEPNLEKIPLNRLEKWQAVQKRLQDFWNRWRREYLCQLQGRNKRWKPAIPVEVGRLVIICDENTPPTRWKMGRIAEVHPGADGVVRVVTLKTASGTLKRPVEKVCFLPTEDDADESAENKNTSEDGSAQRKSFLSHSRPFEENSCLSFQRLDSSGWVRMLG